MFKHTGQHFTLEYEPAERLLLLSWHSDSFQMTDDDYIRSGMEFKEAIQQYAPRCILSDNRNFQFSITPDLQEWTNQEIFPVLFAKGVRRFALLVSPNLFPQISVEQLMEETAAVSFTKRYFERKEEAMEWLVSGIVIG